ncbi:MAG: hypothetical protein RR630_01350 [Coprobacillus sp.]
MDNFYRTENIEVFRKWVYFQVVNDPRLTIEQYDERTFKIFYKNKVARFVIWPIGVIEEAVNEDNELLFYLHYQFYNFHFSKDLFYRMIHKLTEEITQDEIQILLCCSGGMTTGFFAEKMNKYSELNHLKYHFNATSLHDIESVYKDYEMILLAPQLRYKVFEFTDKYKPHKVMSIDPVTFATYDCQILLKQIEEGKQ